MGRVFAATQLSVDRIVAVKTLQNDRETERRATERFLREARVVATLNHPNIVRLIEYGTSAELGVVYIAMDYVEGVTLRETMAAGPMQWVAALQLAARVAEGLAEAHRHGIVHRDLKPENIMVTRSTGNSIRPMILDFGVARREEAGERLTETGVAWGTPLYMAPEQALGEEVDGRADLFALGAILYEMISGRCPHVGDSPVAIMRAKLTDVPPPLTDLVPEIDPAASALVARLLLRHREHRPVSAEAVVHEIRTIVGDAGITLLAGPDDDLAKVARRAAAPRLTVADPVVAGSSSAVTTPVRHSTTAVTVLLLAAVIGGGAAMASILLDDDEPPAPAPVETGSPEPIVVEPIDPLPAPPPEPSVDEPVPPPAVVVMDEPPVHNRTGCGGDSFSSGIGKQALRASNVAGTYHYYVPASYDPARPYPVVMMFHDSASGGVHELTTRGFQEIADEFDLLLFAPDSQSNMPAWRSGADFDFVVAAFKDFGERLCVDPRRRYLLAHGSGNRIAQRIACEYGASALAGTHFRRSVATTRCEREMQVPYLQMLGRDDPVNLHEGGRNCHGQQVDSNEKHIAYWKEGHRCRGKSEEFFEHPHGNCETWSCSESTYGFCLVDGGAQWAGESKGPQLALCTSPRTKFPYREAAWKFFREEGVDVAPQ